MTYMNKDIKMQLTIKPKWIKLIKHLKNFRQECFEYFQKLFNKIFNYRFLINYLYISN